MLFQPDLPTFRDMESVVKSHMHPEHITASGPEQDFLSRYYADKPWYNLSVRYNYQLHQIFHQMNPTNTAERKIYLLPENRDKIKILHYSGALKPWHHVCDAKYHDLGVEEYLDEILSGFDTYQKWYKFKF